MIAPEYDNPNGVPIDAILFGGRRKTTVPLVYESRDWQHGTFIGATLSSETTAAATGAVGVVRRDPMAMLPFIGYHAGDYMNHWLEIGKSADASKLPRIFGVNWFRRDEEDGSFLWPGFGENSRVLKWVIERLDGDADAVETPIGFVPTEGSLDIDGLDMTPEQVAKAVKVDAADWEKELPLIQEWFDKFGDQLPAELWAEFDGLKARVSGQLRSVRPCWPAGGGRRDAGPGTSRCRALRHPSRPVPAETAEAREVCRVAGPRHTPPSLGGVRGVHVGHERRTPLPPRGVGGRAARPQLRRAAAGGAHRPGGRADPLRLPADHPVPAALLDADRPAARHLRRHAGVHRDQHARVHDARRDAPDALP